MEISKDDKIALVFKASHIGAEAVIEYLIKHPSYEQILVFDDKIPQIDHHKVSCYKFDLKTLADLVKGNDLYCFYDIEQPKNNKPNDIKVRNLYSFQIAKAAALNGVSQCMLLSSISSSKVSMNFNSRIRAHLEESVNALPFWAVHIFRPSAVVNTENQSRWGEQIANRLGKGLDRITGGLVSKYRPVEANLIAEVMVKAAQGLKSGRFLYHDSYFADVEEQEEGLAKR